MASTATRTIGSSRRAARKTVPNPNLISLPVLAAQYGENGKLFGRTADEIVCGSHEKSHHNRSPSLLNGC